MNEAYYQEDDILVNEVVQARTLYEIWKVFAETYKYLDRHSDACSRNQGALGCALSLEMGILSSILPHPSVLLRCHLPWPFLAYFG